VTRLLALVLAATLASGCFTSTEHGECVGAFDDRDPGLTYKMSWWNVTMAVFFMGLIVPPIYVAAEATMCPEGVRPAPVLGASR
jgi:hypothetical protein